MPDTRSPSDPPVEAPTLRELFASHEGRKSDKWEAYFPVYERAFAALRERRVSLVEIGVQNGGSLELWARWFAQARAVVGCDVNPKCRELAFANPRIHVVVGDVATAETRLAIAARAPRPDIVIDDGSHASRDVIAAFRHFYPLLAPGGVYVVEDLHCSYWSRYHGGLWRADSAIEFFKMLVDVVNLQAWGVRLPPGHRIARAKGDRRTQIRVEDFASIDGVHFHNSMCVITKGRDPVNTLGGRVVVGCEAAVDDRIPAGGSPLPVPAQPANERTLGLATQQHTL